MPQPPFTALLVEPDTDTRELYTYALEQGHWTVVGACDGAEGLSAALCQRPDVVITELAMPEVDGFELCRRLRQNSSTLDIPIVVVTASVHQRDLARAADAGGDIVVPKPCLPADLVQVLAEVIAQGRELRRRSDQHLQHAEDVRRRSQALLERAARWNERWGR